MWPGHGCCLVILSRGDVIKRKWFLGSGTPFLDNGSMAAHGREERDAKEERREGQEESGKGVRCLLALWLLPAGLSICSLEKALRLCMKDEGRAHPYPSSV